MLPGSMSWSGEINETVLWSGDDAANSIPCDSIPLSFLGARFVNTIIFFPFRSSWL